MKFIGKKLKLWEIMKDGKNGEIFEITECALTSYIGTQVKVQETQDYRGKYKTLVKPEANDNPTDASNIVTIFGCMGEATWKKVENVIYTPIDFTKTVQLLGKRVTVYKKRGSDYVSVTRYTGFESIGIDDFSDLAGTQFYMKEVI
ncbi:hypothetical protein [Bacillus halotolerans]|uniref:hypothetical protein n=1 Tax=Bacillus subtilis group TaxID=653685 RepID=UPI00084AB3D3|nr:hypothetical protein [Bacillus halotolerans]OEC78269.1 hypothetical protein BCV60_03980 [Bacillus halotolerans]